MDVDTSSVFCNIAAGRQLPKENNTKIIFKQLLVTSGVWTAYFLCGLSLGAPTVFIPQIRRDASFNATVDDEITSWLASAHTYSGVLGMIILCTLARYIGRKFTFFVVSLSSLAGYVMFYCSSSIKEILISEIVLGLQFGSQASLSCLISTEYTSPRYRGIFLAMKAGVFFWGVWIANAVGTFFLWRNIPLIGIVCSTYIALNVIFWPESPYWLASRGRYDACSVAHRWLKGHGDDAEKELNTLIANQRGLRKNVTTLTTSQRILKEPIQSKSSILKPILLSVLLMALYALSGKLVCSIYAVEIMKKITSSEYAAYTGMLTLDGITVLSMYVAGGLAKVMRRRALLLTSTSISILIILTASLYLYLIRLGLAAEHRYVVLVLLSMFSISISCGPVSMSTTIYCELVPLRYRNTSMLIIGILSHTILATVLKLGPLIFTTFDVHGAFLFYGVCSLILVVLLYKYLPETKDKTLQEIQDVLNGKMIKKDDEDNKELL